MPHQRTIVIASYIILTALMIPAFTFAQNYTLVWSDEFDSTSVNTNEWEYEVNGNGGGNNELQYYTANAANSSIGAGVFTITARNQFYLGKNYTSARLHTKKSWKYGKVEARIKLPYGKGIWPAFWMLGANINTVSWPSCGEIDIMEMIGGPTTANGGDGRVFGTAHWNSNGHASYGLSKALSSGKFADDFHLFSITWDATKIIWYIDNNFYCIISTTPATLNAFRAPFFIILNLAVGGNWPGSPDATTTFPQKMEVDYVRVYQDIPTGVNDAAMAPNGFGLEQNYPNPFNPTTMINYHVARNGHVTLTIFDAIGREVAVMVNEVKYAGSYSVVFDAKNLASGTYFAKLHSGDKTLLRKMTLNK